MSHKQVYQFLREISVVIVEHVFSYIVQVKTKVKFFDGFQARLAISNLIDIG
jgi:hypothetical protein